MNKIILIFAGLMAAVLLLTGTFVTAAAMKGAELSTLPVIGKLFPEALEASVEVHTEAPNASVEEVVKTDRRSPEQVIDMSASPLQAFLLPTPWSAVELEALEQKLQSRMGSIAEREKQLDERERLLEDSQRHLADLQMELENVRTGLITERDDTLALEDELVRKQEADKARRAANLKRMSSLFADGDSEESARLLLDTYPNPVDAGIVLSGLTPDRVRDLMQGIRAASQDKDQLTKIEASYRENSGPPSDE